MKKKILLASALLFAGLFLFIKPVYAVPDCDFNDSAQPIWQTCDRGKSVTKRASGCTGRSPTRGGEKYDCCCDKTGGRSTWFPYQPGKRPSPTPAPGAPKPIDPCFDLVKQEVNSKCASDECLGSLTDPNQPYSGKNPRIHEHEMAWTALGCIPADPAKFVAWVLAFAIKIGGGIAFLLMLWSGFQMMTSSGDPEKLNQAKGILTSAISGLVFIIFSVLLLKIIGIEILELPGFKP